MVGIVSSSRPDDDRFCHVRTQKAKKGGAKVSGYTLTPYIEIIYIIITTNIWCTNTTSQHTVVVI